MKRMVAGLGVLLLAGVSFGQELTASNWYGSVNIGYSQLSDDAIEAGTTVGVAVGKQYKDGTFATELELFKQNNNIKFDGSLEQTGLMANGKYRFVSNSKWTPYAVGGVGVVYAELEGTETTTVTSTGVTTVNILGVAIPADMLSLNTTTVGQTVKPVKDTEMLIAYQLGLGTEYAITDTISIDGSVRYRSAFDTDFDIASIDVGGFSALIGVNYRF